jgi:hypothetical protein
MDARLGGGLGFKPAPDALADAVLGGIASKAFGSPSEANACSTPSAKRPQTR